MKTTAEMLKELVTHADGFEDDALPWASGMRFPAKERAVNIVALTGAAGSGKDTVADTLVRNHEFVKIGLADAMKRFLHELFDFSDEQLWGPSEKRNAPDKRYPRPHTYVGEVKGKTPCACCGRHAAAILPADDGCFLTPRFALQQLGTQWGRTMYEDVWIDLVLKTTKELSRDVVIPDCRFPNELRRIREVGGKIWHRSGGGSLEGVAAMHISETALADVDTYDAVIPWLPDVDKLPGIVKTLVEEK